MTARIGILGSGQLAQMLLEAAQKLGLDPCVYSESVDSPALQLTDNAVIGAMNDREQLQKFVEGCDTIAFENEFLDCELLSSLTNDRSDPFFPSLDSLQLLQDKLSQKNIFKRLQIPSPAFEEFKYDQDFNTWLRTVFEQFGNGCVLKWSRQGYDGKGVLIVRELDSNEALLRAHAFLKDAQVRNAKIFAEKLVNFKQELALVSTVAMNADLATNADPTDTGKKAHPNEALSNENLNIVFYPLVISEQTNGICDKVFGPATSLGVAPSIETQAQSIALNLAQEFNLVGTFAIEFFLDNDEKLWVNEVAPRVHNSGHFSQEATNCSQFENHIRALAQMPLIKPSSAPLFAMYNLIGLPKVQLSLDNDFRLPSPPSENIFPHWYFKKAVRPGRKLGHINALMPRHSPDPTHQEESLAQQKTKLAKQLETYRNDCMKVLKA